MRLVKILVKQRFIVLLIIYFYSRSGDYYDEMEQLMVARLKSLQHIILKSLFFFLKLEYTHTYKSCLTLFSSLSLHIQFI